MNKLIKKEMTWKIDEFLKMALKFFRENELSCGNQTIHMLKGMIDAFETCGYLTVKERKFLLECFYCACEVARDSVRNEEI